MDPEGESPREGDLDPKKMVQRFPSPVNINRTAIFPSDPQGGSTLPLKVGTAYQRTLLLIFLFRSSYIWFERRDAPDLFESSSCVIFMQMRACFSSVSLNRSSAISMNLEIPASRRGVYLFSKSLYGMAVNSSRKDLSEYHWQYASVVFLCFEESAFRPGFRCPACGFLNYVDEYFNTAFSKSIA